MTIDRATGRVYLIGIRCFYRIDPARGEAETFPTEVQFESIAVDERTGNVFLAGRESAQLGFFDAKRGELRMIGWTEGEESLVNLNQTPPPPIRKVVSDGTLGLVAAVDGYGSSIHLFDAATGKLVRERSIPLTPGGRWHLAGYDRNRHRLYLVVETEKRKVIEAASIDIAGEEDEVVPLPGFTEAVGITYSASRNEVYIPYDNHPSLHVVEFGGSGAVHEIMLPAYGNDATALDEAGSILYVASWAHGEVDVVDLEERRLVKRITGLGIIPHMFTMALDPERDVLYFPKGATAVNGTFGAAITRLDPLSESTRKIRIGWTPVDLVVLGNEGTCLVFGSEDSFVEVSRAGDVTFHRLPYDYPLRVVAGAEGDVYLSYGPHQSYWPVVYIWGAKNGILTIDGDDLSFYDRRIPRQALALAIDDRGALYFTQNNWGREAQFIGVLEDPVRLFEPARSITLPDTVEREVTQRILEYDPAESLLYLVRTGETDNVPGYLQLVDPFGKGQVARVRMGLTPTDLVFDGERIYVANFDSRSVSVVDKRSLAVREVEVGEGPLRLASCGGVVYVVCHGSRSLVEVREGGGRYGIPGGGRPDNLFSWKGKPLVSSHTEDAFFLWSFDPKRNRFDLLYEDEYPFGDTRFDTANASFYMRGQFGDGILEITRAVEDASGRLWITDFLSGRLYVLEGK